MAEQKIELKKTRDFSENINDTFLFIRQNFKPLVLSFLGIAGLFILANSVFSGLYQSQFSGVFKQIFGNLGREQYSPFQLINQNYFLLLLLSLLSMNAMQVCVISYIKVYDPALPAPTIQQVWAVFSRWYLNVFFFSIPVYLLMIVGFFFCLAPGVYFAVVLTPFPVVMIIEEKGFGDAFSRCFEIIKKQFWPSLLLYVVVYLIYSFSSGIISFMLATITGALSYFSTGQISTTIGMVSSVLTAFSFVFYIVYYVSVTLHYFNLVEKRDGTGMLERLDRLGEHGAGFNNIQEQY